MVNASPPGNADTVISSRPNFAATPADWPADLLRFVASLTIDDFVLGGTDLDSSLDLLAVVQKRSGSPRS